MNKQKPYILLGCVISLLMFSYSSLATGPDAETQAIIEELSLRESPEPISQHPRWKKPEKIHLYLTQGVLKTRPDLLDWFNEVTGDVELVPLVVEGRRTPKDELIKDAEVFIGRCFPSVFKAATDLRWYHNLGVGVDSCMSIPEFRQAEFLVTNNQRVSAPAIAEHVIAMMLMLTRNLHGMHTSQLKGKWERSLFNPSNMVEVGGKTMLVAGLGGIGEAVARRAHGLGMRIIATRNSSRNGPDYIDYVGLSDELLELVKQADVIVNAMPLTEKNTGVFNKIFFDTVKPGVYFISVGRGKHTVTDDLINALEDGTLAGAGLDVFDPEPLPEGHKLWTTRNVIISPHRSSPSDRLFNHRWTMVRENIRRYINGEKMLNVVNVKLGY